MLFYSVLFCSVLFLLTDKGRELRRGKGKGKEKGNEWLYENRWINIYFNSGDLSICEDFFTHPRPRRTIPRRQSQPILILHSDAYLGFDNDSNQVP